MACRAVGSLVSVFDYVGEAGYTRQWNFAVEALPDEPVALPEHEAFAWVSLADYTAYPMTPEMLRACREALTRAPA
jgi:hypothetical protein